MTDSVSSAPASVTARPRPRVLLVQPSIQPPGGGNAIAAWLLEALREDYELHLQLWEPPDLKAVNIYYGTRLPEQAFVVHVVPAAWRRTFGWASRRLGIPLQLLVRKLVMRAAADLEPGMDLVISASNEIKSSRPAVQYIHFPWGYWPRPDAEMRWFHRVPGILRLYYLFAWVLFPVTRQEVARNHTLVNSAWTGRRYHETYGAQSQVLFPPIAGEPPEIAWSARRNDFVALGRIDRLKRLEHTIAVIEAVRSHGHPVGLTILGSEDNRAYVAAIRGLAAERPWVTMRTDLTRDELLRELASHRYGLHSMIEEHFGMAVAEMVLAGCIPFVHAEGGPVEIVADERLAYRDSDEAVRKIVRVLEDHVLQEDLRRHLRPRAELFRVERFCARARSIVAELIAGRKPSDAPPERHF